MLDFLVVGAPRPPDALARGSTEQRREDTMTSRSESSHLTDEETTDLTERVERFRAAWSPEGSTDLSMSLPPPEARHRSAVLVQIVLTDMERRAAAGLPFRVERYINLFPEELASNSV